MKVGWYVINTARGSIVDESALYDAIVFGQVAGASLDVFETGPYVPVEPAKDLRKLAQVLLTPHVSSSTVEACQRMAHKALANIKAAFERKYERLDIVNPEVIGKL